MPHAISPTFRPAITLAGTLMLALAGPAAAGPGGTPSILGDAFTVDLFDIGQLVDTGTGIAGGPGIDVNILAFQDLRCDWMSPDEFELDWFGTTSDDFQVVLRDLDFSQDGFPRRITGVTEVSNEFGLPYALSFADRSITIDYGVVDDFEAADGEIVTYRVDSDWYDCPGGGVTGDAFGVGMTVDGLGMQLPDARAGVDGFDVNEGGPYPLRIEWSGCRTFELDFFSNNGPVDSLSVTLTGLDFSEAGAGRTISGLTDLGSEFGWPYTTTITDTGLIITYGPLDSQQAADGEIITFRVELDGGCPGDIDGNGAVDTTDLISMLAGWGPCACDSCSTDLDGSGTTDISDLISLLAAWGPC